MKPLQLANVAWFWIALLHSFVLPTPQVKVLYNCYLLLRLKRTWRNWLWTFIIVASTWSWNKGIFWLVRGRNEGRKSLNLDIHSVNHFPGVVNIGVWYWIDCLLARSNSLWRWKVCIITALGFTWMCQGKFFFFVSMYVPLCWVIATQSVSGLRYRLIRLRKLTFEMAIMEMQCHFITETVPQYSIWLTDTRGWVIWPKSFTVWITVICEKQYISW